MSTYEKENTGEIGTWIYRNSVNLTGAQIQQHSGTGKNCQHVKTSM